MYTLRPPSLPRHPVPRALVLIAGAVLLAGLVMTGLLLGAAVVAIGALTLLVRRWLGRNRHQHPDPRIIDGEFTVAPSRPRTALPSPE